MKCPFQNLTPKSWHLKNILLKGSNNESVFNTAGQKSPVIHISKSDQSSVDGSSTRLMIALTSRITIGFMMNSLIPMAFVCSFVMTSLNPVHNR
jgi:hypothetical protein